MKVTVFLRKDHETLRSIFGEYEKSGSRVMKEKSSIFDELERELTVHTQIENEIFYPALQNTPSVRATELVETARADHRSIEELLRTLRGMNAHDTRFQEKMTKLISEVNSHIDHEEGEIFEEARQNLPESKLEELGLEAEDRRRLLTQLAA